MDLSWYVIQTKPKQENRVELYLNLADIEVFNPKIEEVRLIRGKRKKVKAQLFPGYVFAKLKPSLFELVTYTRGVIKILGINGRPKPIEEKIIETIRERINGNNLLYVPESYEADIDLQRGDYVVILSGPLKGFVGVVEKVNGLKVILLIISMNYQVKAEVHKFLLDKIDPEILE